jgi:hypothetical protein
VERPSSPFGAGVLSKFLSAPAVLSYRVTGTLDETTHLNKKWRRGQDSNLRCRCRHTCFQDRRIQPLCHPSPASYQFSRVDAEMSAACPYSLRDESVDGRDSIAVDLPRLVAHTLQQTSCVPNEGSRVGTSVDGGALDEGVLSCDQLLVPQELLIGRYDRLCAQPC